MADIPFLTSLLSIEYKMERPPVAIQQKIAGLKGLLEFQSPVDWRRGTGAPVQENRWKKPATAAAPVGRYQSRFKKDEGVEGKILQNILLSKLNKFSESTYIETRDFIKQIMGSNDAALSEMIREFMLLVFRKAANERVFCSLYAKLICELSEQYPVLLEEMTKLQENYMAIFKNVVATEGGYDAFVEFTREKAYRQGYSQFIAELVGYEILQKHILRKTFETIRNEIVAQREQADARVVIEEYIDCMSRMASILEKKNSAFATEMRAELTSVIGEFLEEVLARNPAHVGISQKSRFICMNIKDFLAN